MKLKEAISVADRRGFDWIAVDSDKVIRGHWFAPMIDRFKYPGIWYNNANTSLEYSEEDNTIGEYTGKKNWRNTLRFVQNTLSGLE